jgi:hypothetical protein
MVPTWVRDLGPSGLPNLRIVETMHYYPSCVRWVVDSEGCVRDVVEVTIATEDPRKPIQRYFVEAVGVYNRMADSSAGRIQRIWTKENPLDVTRSIELPIFGPRDDG